VSFATTPYGRVHYVEAGSGPTVLLLHQTPRSVDEYAEVLPLLKTQCRAIAIDTLGFGDSDAPLKDPSIELYARAAAAVLAQLGVSRAAVVGHHTGGVIAVELAASRPELVDALVLSSTPYVDEQFRRDRAERPLRVDTGDFRASRAEYYPPGRPDLLDRYVDDARRADDPVVGHRAVHRYRMEERLAVVRARVLLIGATADPFAYPHLERMREQLPSAQVLELAGGIPLPDERPQEFARAVSDFLA